MYLGGQTTASNRNIYLYQTTYFLYKVPANMTNLHPPLDLTVNGYAKAFMKGMFTEWFASQISEAP